MQTLLAAEPRRPSCGRTDQRDTSYTPNQMIVGSMCIPYDSVVWTKSLDTDLISLFLTRDDGNGRIRFTYMTVTQGHQYIDFPSRPLLLELSSSRNYKLRMHGSDCFLSVLFAGPMSPIRSSFWFVTMWDGWKKKTTTTMTSRVQYGVWRISDGKCLCDRGSAVGNAYIPRVSSLIWYNDKCMQRNM